MTTIILSAPHSLCVPSKKRMCDIAAEPAVQCMKKSLGAYYGHENVIYILSTEFREDHDLNRFASRETPYRRLLRSVMKASLTNAPVLLLDIHSFPDYYMKEAGDINFFKPGQTPPELVLMQGPLDTFQGHSLSKTLCSVLQDKGVDCKIIKGVTVLDITNEARDHNIPAILLEFNERLAQDTTRLGQICELISSALFSLSHNSTTSNPRDSPLTAFAPNLNYRNI